MNFDLSKLGNVKVETLVQQGLDTILRRQTNAETESSKNVVLIKKSLDRKGELYRLSPSHKFTIAAYQIRHQNATVSVLIVLDNLRDFNKMLNQEILGEAGKGHLRKADKYIYQKHNVDINNYPHRIKAYRVTKSKAKILTWIIDWNFHKETSSENSYGSGTARALVQEMAISCLDHSLAKESRRDYLDTLIDIDWVQQITQVAQPFYNHIQLSHKVIYHQFLEKNIFPSH